MRLDRLSNCDGPTLIIGSGLPIEVPTEPMTSKTAARPRAPFLSLTRGRGRTLWWRSS
jgi:hypothetical protein